MAVIVGIDPAVHKLGWGVLEREEKSITYITSGVHEVRRGRWSSLGHLQDSDIFVTPLYDIWRLTEQLLMEFEGAVLALESPYVGINRQTGMSLTRAQATCALAGITNGNVVHEYLPGEVKKTVTGVGNASKEQVWQYLRRQIDIDLGRELHSYDESDALAIALTDAYRAIHEEKVGVG